MRGSYLSAVQLLISLQWKSYFFPGIFKKKYLLFYRRQEACQTVLVEPLRKCSISSWRLLKKSNKANHTFRKNMSDIFFYRQFYTFLILLQSVEYEGDWDYSQTLVMILKSSIWTWIIALSYTYHTYFTY